MLMVPPMMSMTIYSEAILFTSHPHTIPHILDSPAHTTPYFFDHFAGTSTRVAHATHDDIFSEMHTRNARDAERDNFIYAMHKQQTYMIQRMNQIQTQKTNMMEQMGQMQGFITDMTDNVQLIQTTQASLLWHVHHMRAS